MCTSLVQKLYLLLLVGLFLPWQILTHPVYGESHARSLISPTLESSDPAVIHERGGKLCGLSCRRPDGEAQANNRAGSFGSGSSIELQPGAIGAGSETLRLYREVKRKQEFFVKTGHSRFWEINQDNRNERQVYSTGVCFGCTVVVVASGRGIYLHHFRQEVGTLNPFEDPKSENFVEHVLGPFDDHLHAYKRSFEGQRPYMVVATPGLDQPQYQNAVNLLRDSFSREFSGGEVIVQPYRLRSMGDSALRDTAAGKIVLQWLPPSNGGDHRLIARVEDNVVLNAHYNGAGQLLS
ncbi:hypothetical protein IFM58399_01231 [Aspergillus lentulus]|uniref:Uncharacterized protein n=1 Tax=Aspergillus lentulus TaxID=293939 RepID=A0ABQ0ZRW2_ASPLE|nr:uncharacterized protein IFM58399_01231 [Aspergillus lentulus]GFF25957.1 hypothetical protein IFM58399_01231 [Aspergillus lentulus]GFF62104.1 hypothetical protein IFM60648_00521 [Aspergillus lentulus]GFF64671.1 hypothetical protein IFM47457_00770 [Aspergillus lentulus]GFG01007.1 hypothetical protein IFM61392_01603 [Aspergillus lentulus]